MKLSPRKKDPSQLEAFVAEINDAATPVCLPHMQGQEDKISRKDRVGTRSGPPLHCFVAGVAQLGVKKRGPGPAAIL